jgi:GxxExxY protein
MPNEQMAKIIINSAFRVHKELGPGLLEKGYEACLVYEITKAGFEVKRQMEVPIAYDRVTLKEYLRLDIMVKN